MIIIKAIIIENKPYCPKCQVLLGNMNGEYRQVVVNGVHMTEFNRYCNSCRGIYRYQASISLDETLRFSFDKVEIIKETKGELKDVDTER